MNRRKNLADAVHGRHTTARYGPTPEPRRSAARPRSGVLIWPVSDSNDSG